MNKKVRFGFPLIFAALLFLASTVHTQDPSYDFIISGAHVIDGTGAPWFSADIGIVGDRIVTIGDLSKSSSAKRVNAAGLVVSPGFIDLQGQSEFSILVDNRAASKITQGVTTEITGEGSSIAPVNDRLRKDGEDAARKYGVSLDWYSLADYFKHFERTKSTINLGTFVGAGGLRNYVMGSDNRPATPAELDQMRQLVAQAMEQGAFGLSSALQYVPDTFASTDEIVELAKVARQYGGVYFTHQRSEGDQIFASLDEAFTIAQQAKISSTIWHLRTGGVLLIQVVNPELAKYEGKTLEEIGRDMHRCATANPNSKTPRHR